MIAAAAPVPVGVTLPAAAAVAAGSTPTSAATFASPFAAWSTLAEPLSADDSSGGNQSLLKGSEYPSGVSGEEGGNQSRFSSLGSSTIASRFLSAAAKDTKKDANLLLRECVQRRNLSRVTHVRLDRERRDVER